MSDDILTQVVTKIKLSNYFAIQLDESTDVADLGQLLVFARYVTMDNLEEEFLFCEPLTGATKASDIMQKRDTFLWNTTFLGISCALFARMVRRPWLDHNLD